MKRSEIILIRYAIVTYGYLIYGTINNVVYSKVPYGYAEVGWGIRLGGVWDAIRYGGVMVPPHLTLHRFGLVTPPECEHESYVA